MKYKVVIFDLFGTLVDIVPEEENRRVTSAMADVLGAPREPFIKYWKDNITKRMTGEFSDYQECIRYICHEIGINARNSCVEKAARLRVEMEIRELEPREHAIELLTYLKLRGIKTGLISGCSAVVPALWSQTPFKRLIDAPIFSCEAGIMKPDPRIYWLAMERLMVEPGVCLYIADGIGEELAGAVKLGMDAIMIRTPKDDSGDPYREKWEGVIISSLSEVMDLLE